MVIPKLAYPGTTDGIVNISLLHPRFIGSCNYQPKQMERKGMLPSFVLFRSICPNMVDLWTWLLMLWMILISDRRITHGRNNRDHNQSIKSQNNVCVHALISWWSLRWIKLVHTFIFSVPVPIFPLFCSKRKELGLYKTLQEIRLVQYIFASYSNIKKVLCIFHEQQASLPPETSTL